MTAEDGMMAEGGMMADGATKADGGRLVVEIDEELCDGCGECVPACHEGALRIVEGKARLVSDSLCDGLGACIGDCPRGAIRVVQRQAAPFASPAVPGASAASVASAGPATHATLAPPAPTPCCPSMSGSACGTAGESSAEEPSFLGHWPIQIRLAQPKAPFFHEADLVVAADCVPVACPSFHRDFVRDHAVLIGCPKFDDLEDYARRFARIFQESQVRRVTVVVMQVPCCQSLPLAVLHGLAAAGREIPVEKVVIGIDGRELARTQLAPARGAVR